MLSSVRPLRLRPAPPRPAQEVAAPILLSPPHLTGREIAVLEASLASGWLAPAGPAPRAFEAAFAEATGIESLRATTRDIPDYDVLMKQRLRILDEHKLGLQQIQDVIARECPPLQAWVHPLLAPTFTHRLTDSTGETHAYTADEVCPPR